jgi:hypothetical protein
MCVHYTDINKACKKDPFRHPWIDQVKDSTAGCRLLSFLDCYSLYHRIPLKVEDQIKTSFITLLAHFVIELCHSDLRAQMQLTTGVYNSVCIHRLGTTLKHTMMMWS